MAMQSVQEVQETPIPGRWYHYRCPENKKLEILALTPKDITIRIRDISKPLSSSEELKILAGQNIFVEPENGAIFIPDHSREAIPWQEIKFRMNQAMKSRLKMKYPWDCRTDIFDRSGVLVPNHPCELELLPNEERYYDKSFPFGDQAPDSKKPSAFKKYLLLQRLRELELSGPGSGSGSNSK